MNGGLGTRITFISWIHFLLLLVLLFNFSLFAFSHGLAISFQLEFQKKWKYQIILFDLSVVSLVDIAKIDHASEINLAFAFFKQNVALIDLKLKAFPGILLSVPRNLSEHSRTLLEHSPESLIVFPGVFDSIPRNLFEHFPEFSQGFSQGKSTVK